MTTRAVLYARVSSDDRSKDGRNLTGQLGMCREHALTKGYQIIAELAEDDRGASGASFDLEKLNEALEMAHNREFDTLVVREIDRFARSLAKQLIVEEQLRRSGVQIEYVLGEYPATPEGSLMKNVKASVAEYERLKIAERTTRARRAKVRDGHVVIHHKAPYGYQSTERNGKRSLSIHEPEARVVRMIYDGYVIDKVSLRSIAVKLGDMSIPTPTARARGWHRATVAMILSCETYAGVWHYGQDKNGGGSLYSVKVPAIIDRETWKAAQEQRQRNQQDSARNTKYEYLLRGRATCGCCDYKMSSTARQRKHYKTYLYYRCQTASHSRPENRKRCANKTYFSAKRIDAAVWEWIKSWLCDPDALAAELERHKAERDSDNAPTRRRLAVVDELIAENEGQLERLLDLYLSGDFPRAMLLERKTRLETTIGLLQREQQGLAARLAAVSLSDRQMDTIVEFAEAMAGKLRVADRAFDARRHIVELLDAQARLEPGDEQMVIRVSCVLGDDVLSVASTSSAPTRHNVQKPLILTTRIVLDSPTRGKLARAA